MNKKNKIKRNNQQNFVIAVCLTFDESSREMTNQCALLYSGFGLVEFGGEAIHLLI